MSKLEFKEINISDSKMIREALSFNDSQCCDYTCGVVMMWKDYLNIKYDYKDNMLFLKGKFNGVERFYLPCGNGDLKDAFILIEEYCKETNTEPLLSSIPFEFLEKIKKLYDVDYEESRDYSDYVYSAQSLANLSGRKLHQKRNHISKFKKKYPDYKFSAITEENIDRVKDFYKKFTISVPSTTESERVERECTWTGLNNMFEIGMFGAFIEVDGEIAAFTIGEKKADTIYVHIEKADRNYEGSYSVINCDFVKYCLEKYPEIKWINREDDSGDEGLRKAKLSYHPDHLALKGKAKIIK